MLAKKSKILQIDIVKLGFLVYIPNDTMVMMILVTVRNFLKLRIPLILCKFKIIIWNIQFYFDLNWNICFSREFIFEKWRQMCWEWKTRKNAVKLSAISIQLLIFINLKCDTLKCNSLHKLRWKMSNLHIKNVENI